MKTRSRCKHVLVSLLLLTLASFTNVAAQTDAPQVAATQPRNGDVDVADSVKEIVVTFDQDMDHSGYSFVGGGPTFPQVTGKGSWRSARVCVLPVRLEPGRDFTLGVNSATHSNFKSRLGTPATPFVLTFKTRAADGAAPVQVSADKQSESVRQLRDVLEHQYSYRDVHVVDWPAAWKRFEPRLLAAKSAREFAVTTGEMLAATRDAHIWLVENGEIVPAFRREVIPNANAQRLPGLIAGWSQKHPMVASGKATPQIGYIAIHSWDKKHAPQLLDAALAALAELANLPSLIVDVRFNSGGDETIARQFAGCFVRERSLYARQVSLDPNSPTGFGPPAERWIEPTPDRPAYAGRVAVLMGPANMSSTEAFLLMMKLAPSCQLVGERSYGASGNPQPHLLANGVTVHLPSWKAMLPDGTVFEGKGIAPDVEVLTRSADFAQRDPVLEKAVALVANPKSESK